MIVVAPDVQIGIVAESAQTPTGEPVTVRELVSRNVRRLRLNAAASHEDVARAARHYGLRWTVQWVTAVERGHRMPTAEQLVALPIVLTEAFGHRVGLADLLLGDEPVKLRAKVIEDEPAVPVSGSYLREVATAPPYRRPFAMPGMTTSGIDGGDGALARAAAKMREISRAGLGDVDIRALHRAEAGAGDVEDKLARKLGVAPIIVIAAAAGLWGRSLTEERQARLTVDTFSDEPHPQPATVMRRLKAELTERIEQAAARALAIALSGPTMVLPLVVPAAWTAEEGASTEPEIPRPRMPMSLFGEDHD